MLPELSIPVQFVILFLSLTVLSYLARKFGQPPVVIYILSGLILGPVLLGVVSKNPIINLMSELGLGFLLFLVGMEMKFEDFREILKPVGRIAVGQIILQAALAFSVAFLLGFSLQETGIIALCTIFGATPVVVKILADKDEISSLPGRIDVGVLVLQDIYLVLVLTILAAGNLSEPMAVATSLGKILLMIGLIGLTAYMSSKRIFPRLFDTIADNRHAFFIHGVAWAFVMITFAEQLGLSLEIGAFLAGLSIGQIPYSMELQERIRPLTDFFMMVFFVSIGLSLEASNLMVYWKEALIASLIMVPGNFLIMFFLIDREKFTPKTSFLGGINMTQVSEFSLVVGALAVSQGYIGQDIVGYLSLMALATMSTSAYLITYNKEIFERTKHLLEGFESENKKDVEIRKLENHAVVIGYNEMAEEVCKTISHHYDEVLVVDRNPANVEKLSKSGYEYIYGDFRHHEIRKASRLDKADFVISFSRDKDPNIEAVENSECTVFVRAGSREEAAELYDLGADYVIIKHLLSAEKSSELLELYLEDRELFEEEVEVYLNRLHWGGRKSS